jgi:6-pyruvoyltetrahydropterin/6-carboxytetrahydropterin synthase
MIELTRCYRFPAAHLLAQEDLSQAENEQLYGKCANPAGHGHNYELEVTVTGPIDERTGEVMSRDRLDAMVDQQVLARFAHRMLNDDELFAECVPTAENIARVVYDRLEAPVSAAGGARLARVRVLETRKNTFVYGGSS